MQRVTMDKILLHDKIIDVRRIWYKVHKASNRLARLWPPYYAIHKCILIIDCFKKERIINSECYTALLDQMN